MKRLILIAALTACSNAFADDALIAQGEKVFQHWCATCHGPDERGTEILEQRFQGALPAELAKRTDLSGALITMRVRGWFTPIMPAFRPTEVSDSDLEAIIAYLTQDK